MKDPEVKLGRSSVGKTVSYRLSDLKSILIGGISGSGKSTLINNIIKQIKDDAQVFIIDLKRVCFLNYKKDCTVITDEYDIPILLQKMCEFMEARYIEMENAGTDKCARPRVVLVIDEMADFMLKVGKKEKCQIQQILSLGRQANITVIGATQTPSKQVIGSLIADQFQTKIGLRVNNRYASNVIINKSGCENLPNYSAILIAPDGFSNEIRLLPPMGKEEELTHNLDRVEY